MNLPSEICTLHFLVCDDYETIRLMLIESLKSLGITKISIAKSGNEGFKLLKDQIMKNDPVGFVITDLVMEDGSGIDLAKMIRADAETKSLPILMVTSKSEVSAVLEGIKAGVNNYIVKPWTPEDLSRLIIESTKAIFK